MISSTPRRLRRGTMTACPAFVVSLKFIGQFLDCVRGLEARTPPTNAVGDDGLTSIPEGGKCRRGFVMVRRFASPKTTG